MRRLGRVSESSRALTLEQPKGGLGLVLRRLAMSAVTIVLVGTAWSGPAQVPAAAPRPPFLSVGYVTDDADSRRALLANGHRLSAIITTNYNVVDTAGTMRGRHDARVVDLAHRAGMDVYFRVANYARGSFRKDIAHAVLVKPASRARAISGILRVLDAYHYDGVSLDFENIPSGHRTALVTFVTELSAQVHRRGKVLSIAVPGKAEDEPGHAWSGAFDLAALGRICDFLIIMAYDEHTAGSGAGPVASLPWVQAVTRFAASRVERQKILLGVAFYGYSWPRRGYGVPISMRRAARAATAAGVRVLWDEDSDSPYYRTRYRTVYFENAQSIEMKVALAAREGLAGVAMWRLGLESPDVWEMLDGYVGHPGRPRLLLSEDILKRLDPLETR